MKKIALIAVTALLLFSCNTPQATVEKTIQVYGNCEQCKARIEQAGKIQGVSDAKWNVDSKLLTIKLDTTVTSVDAVMKAIAEAGHDNEGYMGNDYAYQKLPDCCHYERKEE